MNFIDQFASKRAVDLNISYQRNVICPNLHKTMEIFADISYLVRTKGSQSGPNLSKQRLDQKSKDCGAIPSLYTPALVIQ